MGKFLAWREHGPLCTSRHRSPQGLATGEQTLPEGVCVALRTTATPPCRTTEKHHLVPLETQTAGGLREHKDGGLLDRKALVLSLQSHRGRGAMRIARQGGSVIEAERLEARKEEGKRETS